MPPITRFEEIESWQMARELTKMVYGLTSQHGFSKDWGLKDQIQRAAGSAMHNIAEGFDAGSHIEFARFLRYAQRSCTEVQSELYVALDQKYIDQEQFEHGYEQAARTRSKIGAFIRYLTAKKIIKALTPRPTPITKHQARAQH
jgi:four helix bundle protein